MSSFFDNVTLAPPNSILGVALECRQDPFERKIDLTIGAYRDSNGKPVVLESVREAEQLIFESKMDHEYLSQDGHPEFVVQTQKLMFGDDSALIADKKIFTIQGISGTGSLRLATDFIGTFMPGRKCFYPEVTWPNHPTILEASHVEMGTYRYLDETGCNLNISGFLEDLSSYPIGSVILFHNCAHNPSGVDPSEDQWREVMDICKTRNFFPLFDNAYQGFVSGDPTTDAFAARLFAAAGFEMMVVCSFAKNFGLYGERAGALHVVANNPDKVAMIGSQLRVISRSLYSTCPAHCARIVAIILGDPERKKRWEAQCAVMANRLNNVRRSLYEALLRHNVRGTWEHVIKQRGMFSYTGIPAPAVLRLKSEFHIYMLSNGRISLAGLNENNVERFAESVAAVLGKNDAC